MTILLDSHCKAQISGSFIPNSSEILLFWDLTTDIDGDQVNYELYFGNTLGDNGISRCSRR